jgi:hypothetical protein
MHASKAILLGVLLGASSAAGAKPEAPRKVLVPLGGTAPLQLPFPAFERICDDPTVVRIEVARDDKGLQAVGLKVGSTLCGFSESPKSQRIVLQIVVVAPPPEK